MSVCNGALEDRHRIAGRDERFHTYSSARSASAGWSSRRDGGDLGDGGSRGIHRSLGGGSRRDRRSRRAGSVLGGGAARGRSRNLRRGLGGDGILLLLLGVGLLFLVLGDLGRLIQVEVALLGKDLGWRVNASRVRLCALTNAVRRERLSIWVLALFRGTGDPQENS